jgi:hypothetical protein
MLPVATQTLADGQLTPSSWSPMPVLRCVQVTAASVVVITAPPEPAAVQAVAEAQATALSDCVVGALRTAHDALLATAPVSTVPPVPTATHSPLAGQLTPLRVTSTGEVTAAHVFPSGLATMTPWSPAATHSPTEVQLTARSVSVVGDFCAAQLAPSVVARIVPYDPTATQRVVEAQAMPPRLTGSAVGTGDAGVLSDVLTAQWAKPSPVLITVPLSPAA